jgi:hypothetical protein
VDVVRRPEIGTPNGDAGGANPSTVTVVLVITIIITKKVIDSAHRSMYRCRRSIMLFLLSKLLLLVVLL